MIRLCVIAVLAAIAAQPMAWAQSALGGHGWIGCLKGDPDLAIPGCTEALKAHELTREEKPIAYYLRGNAYYAKGQFDRAIEDYNQTISQSPEFARAFNNRGSAYVSRRDYERAIPDFTEAARLKVVAAIGRIDLAPFDPAIALQNRGIAYLHMGDYGHAIQDFSEAIRLSPLDPEAFYHRGIAYNSAGDFGSAIGDYNRSIELNAKNALALYARAIAKRNQDDADGARADMEAAGQIEPDIAAKVHAMTIPVNPIAASGPRAKSTLQPVITCTALLPSPSAAQIPSYVDEPLDQLKRAVPGLRGVKPELIQNAAGPMAAEPGRGETESILSRTGAVMSELLHRMPNLIAKEEVRRAIGSPLPGYALGNRNGAPDVTADFRGIGGYQSRVFSYRIVRRQGPAGDQVLHEFRTDLHDRPIDDSGHGADSPLSVGFATSWLYFYPGNLQESRFRYLGRQKIGNRETYVMAFAQNPEHKRLDTIVDSDYGLCITPNQGVAWIDQSTFRILRMQTDLLSPLPGIQLNQLRAVLNYGEVKIPERNLSLWLPTDVRTLWQTAEGAGDELHSYSHFRLFGSTVRIVPAIESPTR